MFQNAFYMYWGMIQHQCYSITSKLALHPVILGYLVAITGNNIKKIASSMTIALTVGLLTLLECSICFPYVLGGDSMPVV